MISIVAIVMAMNFWAPYNGGVPPCDASTFSPIMYDGQSQIGWTHRGNRYCDDIHLSNSLAKTSIAFQCEVIAHEIGHRFFDLDHSDDPNNIMHDGGTPTVPDGCIFKFRRGTDMRG